jgi:hypothetical protein
MAAWKIEIIVGYLLYWCGFIILYKEIDSLINVLGFIVYAVGMIFLGRSTK